MSLKKLQECLILSHEINILDEEEFCLLFHLNDTRNILFDHKQYSKFELGTISEEECWSNFRFDKFDIPYLGHVLQLPQKLTCYNRTSTGMEEVLCILLRRFAYPCRYVDLMPQFGRSLPELSIIGNKVMDIIYQTHGHLLTTLNRPWLAPDRLKEMADAVHSKGAALENCWGFVDDTVSYNLLSLLF